MAFQMSEEDEQLGEGDGGELGERPLGLEKLGSNRE